MPSKRATQAELDKYLERVEEMLAVGLPSAKISSTLAVEFGVSRRQVQKWIARIDQRWDGETKGDAPFRQERLLRKVSRFYAKAFAEKKYGPAVQALVVEARLSGAFAQRNPELEKLIDKLGPPPSDPTGMLLYAQRLMALAFREVMTNSVLDERRLRWIIEFVKAFGMTHAKAIFESKLQLIEERLGLAPKSDDDGDEGQPTTSGHQALRARRALKTRK